MGLIGLIISWLIIGAIIGLLARAVMPGKQGMGIGKTIVLGVIGAARPGAVGGGRWGRRRMRARVTCVVRTGGSVPAGLIRRRRRGPATATAARLRRRRRSR